MKLPFKGMLIGSESEVVSNPLSGKSTTLTPEAVAVYDVLRGAQMMSMYSDVRKGLDWFRQYYPAEYMVLLD